MLSSRCMRASPGRVFSSNWQVPSCGEREATMVAPPPACDSAVVPCSHGSLVFLHRHSLLQISSLPVPQAIFPQPTAVLAPGLLSNPHAPAPSPCALVHPHSHGARRPAVWTISLYLLSNSLPLSSSLPPAISLKRLPVSHSLASLM